MGVAFDTSAVEHRSVPVPPVPLSVILSLLFIGTHFVTYVSTVVTVPPGAPTIYSTPDYNAVSTLIVALLFLYLGVDFWQWRQRGKRHGRLYVAVFAATALLLAGMAYFLGLVSTL